MKKRKCKMKGWILDEKKAYRQIPVRPAHRKFTVIVLMDPALKRPAYFVMVSHSFGLTAAVYNYNRRSALLNEIMHRSRSKRSEQDQRELDAMEVESHIAKLPAARAKSMIVAMRLETCHRLARANLCRQ